MTSANNKIQLPFAAQSALLRRPVEIQINKESEMVPIYKNLPVHSQENLPFPIRQAIHGFSNMPVLPHNYFESDNSCDESDPEILLTDSEDEDDFNNDAEVDNDTAIDSADLDFQSEGNMDCLDVFDEESIGNDLPESPGLSKAKSFRRSLSVSE